LACCGGRIQLFRSFPAVKTPFSPLQPDVRHLVYLE
jgi:hypothetical protein